MSQIVYALTAGLFGAGAGGVVGSKYEQAQFQSRFRTMLQARILGNAGIPQEVRNRFMVGSSMPIAEVVAYAVAEIDVALNAVTNPEAVETLTALKDFLLSL